MRTDMDIMQLKDATNKILRHVSDDLHVYSYDLPTDYYWDVVGRSVRYNHGAPPATDLGMVSNDWPLVDAIVPGDSAGKVDALFQLSNLLRVVGDHVPDLLRRSRNLDSEVDKTDAFLQDLKGAHQTSGACGKNQIYYQIQELDRERNKTPINIPKLQAVADSILEDVMQHWHVNLYPAPDDFYWDVVGTDRYAPKPLPGPTPGKASLSDDWSVIGKILLGNSAGKYPRWFR